MLSISKMHEAIRECWSDLQAVQADSIDTLNKFADQLHKISTYTPDEFQIALESGSEMVTGFTGALLTDDIYGGIVYKYPVDILSREKSEQWKENVLLNRPVIAVDGSQIFSDKNINLFFGLVQTAWYINYHNSEISSVRDMDCQIVLPSDVSSDDRQLNQEIGFRRFQQEIRKIIELMDSLSALSYQKTPIIFCDGSLTVSFQKDSDFRKKSEEIIQELLLKSRETKIPVVAYIDTSQAYNLVNSLKYIFNLGGNSVNLTDAGVFRRYLTQWGDRSCVFRYYDCESYHLNQICFCYVNNSSYRLKPCRIEFPDWIVSDTELLQEVIDVVLAESSIGNGYIYSIEVADALATIQKDEKDFFCNYLSKHFEMPFHSNPKLKSKLKRRKVSIVS